jgi:hypothetical protein
MVIYSCLLKINCLKQQRAILSLNAIFVNGFFPNEAVFLAKIRDFIFYGYRQKQGKNIE